MSVCVCLLGLSVGLHMTFAGRHSILMKLVVFIGTVVSLCGM